MVANPDEEALKALRAHQEEMGLKFDDPDAPVAVSGDDGLPAWMQHDEEFR
jgi:hypothetical protein